MKPLYDALRGYSSKVSAVFHMPGHKLGRGFIHDGSFDNPALLDVTELEETDDLNCPRGPLREAQEMAARAFGAGKTWFLTNGSSCGIFAMIAANCDAGQKLLIAGDFHYSAFNAMRFSRVKPIYISIDKTTAGANGYTDASYGILSPESVEKTLFEHPDAAALYLTRPGYYGSVCDIAEIVRLAHKRGIPVLVDEAHGAHLVFSNRLPICALEGGADYCVQSAHKTLPAFTQCAYAHVSENRLASAGAGADRFTEAVRAFQTSSPSFILTASLDYAREYMSERGAAELDRILDNCESFYIDMAKLGYGIPGDYLPQTKRTGGSPARYNRDITRLVITTRPLGISGSEAERLLWSRYRIKIEMSEPRRIIMIATVADKDEDFAKLKSALTEIALEQKKRINSCEAPSGAAGTRALDRSGDENYSDDDDGCEAGICAFNRGDSDGYDGGRAGTHAVDDGGGDGKDGGDGHGAGSGNDGDTIAYAYDNSDAVSTHTFDCGASFPDFITELHAPKCKIPLVTAVNRTAADIIAPYPPGIPLLCPGERITGDVINEIRFLLQTGVHIKGIDTTDMTITVYR